jgi:hypothetical protein
MTKKGDSKMFRVQRCYYAFGNMIQINKEKTIYFTKLMKIAAIAGPMGQAPLQ